MPGFGISGHGAKAPNGMSDIRLEAKGHIGTSAQGATEDITKSIGCFKQTKFVSENASRTI